VDRPLPEIMVDAEDRGLTKGPEQNTVELPRGSEVCSERLFDDDAGVRGTARLTELFHDCPKEHRRNGEVVCRSLRGAEFVADCLNSGGVVVVAVHVAQ